MEDYILDDEELKAPKPLSPERQQEISEMMSEISELFHEING